jgi:hypothetical protein
LFPPGRAANSVGVSPSRLECCRFVQYCTWAEEKEFMSVFRTPLSLQSRYNITPPMTVNVTLPQHVTVRGGSQRGTGQFNSNTSRNFPFATSTNGCRAACQQRPTFSSDVYGNCDAIRRVQEGITSSVWLRHVRPRWALRLRRISASAVTMARARSS